MLAMNERAVLYAREGIVGGRPAYARGGVTFTCRAEPCERRESGANGQGHGLEVRLYAPPMQVHTGDRIVMGDGQALVVEEARILNGPGGAHHVELLAGSEG